jgi:hypothetical protein
VNFVSNPQLYRFHCEYRHSPWALFSVKETKNAVIANEVKQSQIAAIFNFLSGTFVIRIAIT